MTFSISKTAATAAAALAVIALAACSSGEPAATTEPTAAAPTIDYPTGTVTLVVPYAAGGVTDLAARVIAEGLTEELGQTFIVENKPGASGVTGTAEVAMSDPDGYTIQFSASAVWESVAYRSQIPYTMEDFDPITGVFLQPYVLVTPAGSPYSSFDDLEGLGAVTYAVSSIGGQTHTNAALLFEQLGIEATAVPFDGAAPAVQAIVGGQTDFFFGDLAQVMPFISSGDLNPLAVLNVDGKPVDAIADVPTLESVDIDTSEMTFPIWGFATPAGTDPQILTLLSDAMRKVIEGKTFTDFAKQNYYPLLEGDAATNWWETVESNGVITEKVLKDLGITL
jgi:tripartite-type tricarboxylate transporter receptor subunit TctC